MSDHESAAILFLRYHAFELPQEPTLPPLDVAERDLSILSTAVMELATALGLECGIELTRSLIPHPRGMVEIREKLALLRAAVSLTAAEMGIPEKHIDPDKELIAAFSQLFIRGRRRVGQVT